MSESSDMDDLGTLGQGRYVLTRSLGTGASAVVYQARDTALGVDRAIKVLHPQSAVADTVRQRLQGEARAMARLNHRHVLRVYDIGVDEGREYVVMDLAAGGNLARLVDENGPMSEAVALRYGLQVLSALAAAHAEGIVHRDVKPHNVLLDDKGVALLADFGIALHLDNDALRATRTGMALGTLAFMAPEQRLDARAVGPAADIYAIGATLFYLITADNPVDLFGVDAASDRWRGLSDPVRDILVRATRYEPADRYATAADMAREIVSALAADGAVHEDPLDPRTFPEPSGRFAALSQTRPIAAPTMEWKSATDEAITALLHVPEEFPVTRSAAGSIQGPTTVDWIVRFTRRNLVLLLLAIGIAATLIIAALASRPDVPVAEPVPEPVEPVVTPDVAPEIEPEVAPAPVRAPAASAHHPVAARPSVPPAPAPVEAPAGPPPLGHWTGSFNGRPAVFDLGGTPEEVRGTVTVRFGGNGVASAVTGRFDADTRTLVLEDADDTIDSGRYSATLSEDGTALAGRFEGRHNGRLSPFSLRREP